MSNNIPENHPSEKDSTYRAASKTMARRCRHWA